MKAEKGYSSSFMKTLGLEKIFIASSISPNLVSISVLRFCARIVSERMGRERSSFKRAAWSGGKEGGREGGREGGGREGGRGERREGGREGGRGERREGGREGEGGEGGEDYN